MGGTTDLPGKQTPDGTTVAGGVKQQDAVQTRWRVVLPLCVLGFMLLAAASVIVRLHPAPWPFDLQTTITLQNLQLPSWVSTLIVWVSIVDNPIPTEISYVAWLVVLSLIGVVVWRRGGSPIPWFVTAIFLSLGVAAMAGLDRIIANLVARPRPSSPLIHVYMPEPGIPSFPSGHVENDVVYYGFLLYLSLTKPVSEWRYRWILIPFQLYAVLNILLIGFSRVLEGSHWLTDALAGYVVGIRVIIFALLPSFGMSNAAATMVGQALGARNPDRAERAVWKAGSYNVVFLGVVGLMFILFAGPIIRVFTVNPHVVPYGIDCLRIISCGFLFYAYGMVLGQSFNGAGDTWTPTIINLFVFWLWELPLAYVLAIRFGMGPRGVFIAITIAFSTLAVVSAVVFRQGRWKTRVV